MEVVGLEMLNQGGKRRAEIGGMDLVGHYNHCAPTHPLRKPLVRHKPEKVGDARVAENHHSRGRRGDQTKRRRDERFKRLKVGRFESGQVKRLRAEETKSRNQQTAQLFVRFVIFC
jgi:hypothetical protein